MTCVLIPTYPSDIHATVVAEALAVRGHKALLWQGADFPTRQHGSFSLEEDGEVGWEISGPQIQMSSRMPIDVVWLRRPVTDPVLPEDMHPGDRVVAQRECSTFSKNLWHLVAPHAFWVNPLGSRQRSSAKAVQLQEAIAVGLKVPPTLFSNDPKRIRAFLKRYERQTIYKSFYPAQWVKERGSAQIFTASVTADDLPEDEILRLAPGIFQKRIEKAFELRITCIGEHLVVAKLLSQEIPSARIDWKLAFTDLRVEAGEIPQAVEQACKALCRRLGLVFACIDVIVTPEGEHVFLEVNEMGQFLWVEELSPGLRLLDLFCEFLMQARVDFGWYRSSGNLRFADFRDHAEAKQREVYSNLHVAKPAYFSVRD
jgi:glutathione synthase/RimK-type ligase-like ATP-grasp enzyme